MTTPRAVERTVFLADGFNLYHSLEKAVYLEPTKGVKWLDLNGLFSNVLGAISGWQELTAVYYFTAYANYQKEHFPDKLTRHRAYVRALTASGVHVKVHDFKRKTHQRPETGERIRLWEEKETDVAIACKLLELAARDELDTAVLVTGDTDLRPAVETFQSLYPKKRILFAFPFSRKNRELEVLAPDSFILSRKSYAENQFPDKVRLPSNKYVHKPREW